MFDSSFAIIGPGQKRETKLRTDLSTCMKTKMDGECGDREMEVKEREREKINGHRILFMLDVVTALSTVSVLLHISAYVSLSNDDALTR